MPADFRFPSFPILLLSGLCLLPAACGGDASSAAAAEAAPAAVVTTQVATLRPWRYTTSALGTVKSRESVTITAKVSETVERVHFESGDEVGANAPLVTLSGNQQRASLQAAE